MGCTIGTRLLSIYVLEDMRCGVLMQTVLAESCGSRGVCLFGFCNAVFWILFTNYLELELNTWWLIKGATAESALIPRVGRGE